MPYDDDKKFENFPYYDGPLGFELGSSYTTFRVWAPSAESVTLRLYREGMFVDAEFVEKMDRGENGLFDISVPRNLAGYYYDYLVVTGGKKYATADPYAVSSGANGERSMVLDLPSTDPEGWSEDRAPARQTEDIIYEIHVKDFTYQSFSGISGANRGRYLGLAEEGTSLTSDSSFPTGLSYLRNLGITHVQLMPVYDYGSVDELGSEDEFNWGYDPVQYNVPEGSYSSDAMHGEVRVRELKSMILALHRAGIRVVMDVVYNHTYHLDSCLFRMEPWYFYRRNPDGTSSNGSGCGNDIATERPMVHRYILDSVLYWAREYHIDGFRFDLMGLMDMALIQDIRNRLDEIYGKGEKLMYGEPWSAGMTAVAKGTQLADKSALMLMDENIGAFCDATRDLIKGSTFEVRSKGFSNGGRTDLSLFTKAFTGWSDGDWRFRVKAPSQTISYVSSHDDWTLWDKLVATMNENEMFLSLDENVMKANKLAASLYFTMQGRLFMLSGEEAARTKLGIRNSYASPIFINRFDWERAGQARELVEFYKGLIALRKALPCLTDKSAGAKDRLVFFRPISDRTALLLLDDHDGPYDEIMLLYTQERDPFTIPVDGKWMILSDSQCSNRLDDPITADMKISSRGMEVMVLGRNRDGNDRADS